MFADMGLLTGVEIGVAEGRFSSMMLSEERIERLWSIDPFLTFPERSVYEPMLKACRLRLAPFGDRSILLVEESPGAAAKFEDGGLGFVYIDGDHSYEACLADMTAWWPKVRSGGVMSGHDYTYNGRAMCPCLLKVKDGERMSRRLCGKCEVRRAVDEFLPLMGLKASLAGESWWVVKP